MTIPNTKYVVITPVRDEEKHIEKNIQSMISQTVLPVQWILVDDGSTDATGKIIDTWAEKNSWIVALHRENRGFRKSGGGVMEAFYHGYAHLKSEFDFIVKLDGDLQFESDYFEKCFEHFEQDSQLGIGGGIIQSVVDDSMILEKNPKFHVRGATKIYRKSCWDAIGILIKAPGWDTLDEVKANMKGWKTSSFPELILTQLKFTGSADGNWKNLLKNGKGSYIAGYHPLFMLIKSCKYIMMRPYFISSLALFSGFLSGYFMKIPRIEDKELMKFIRREQLKKIFFMKSMWM